MELAGLRPTARPDSGTATNAAPAAAADRRPSLLRTSIAIAAVSAIGVTSLVTNAVAAANPEPAALGFTAQAGTAAAFESRASQTSRDSAREAIDSSAMDRAAAERVKELQAAGEEVAGAQQALALQARQESLNAAIIAIAEEADRLKNLKNFFIPTAGAVSSEFGMRRHPILGYTRMHNGQDIGGACGQPIYAAQSGTVVQESYGYSGGSGNNIHIDHGVIGGVRVRTAYLHGQKFIVHLGEYVKRGQLIGYVGSTGLSTACHLHLSLYENDRGADPAKYLHNV